jgi:bacillithiol system protein YtxJ
MAVHINNISSLEHLDELFVESHIRPVLLFKHSNSCGLSTDVFEQVSAVIHSINLVIVQRDRQISNAVAERLAIRHASPQAFVLWEGRPIYHATHYAIDPVEIENKLANK